MPVPRRYTFIEMLIVAVILLLVTAVVMPSMLHKPARWEIEGALGSIRQAVLETATRARATGKAMQIVLDLEASTFVVSALDNGLGFTRSWEPPLVQDEELAQTMAVAVASKSEYEMPESIEWLPEDTGWGADEDILYAFFEDGQASGRPLRFRVAGHYYQFDVDRLTGNPLIEEL